MTSLSFSLILSILTTLLASSSVNGEIENFGVCYGLNGDNLPPPKAVVALYKQYGIQSMLLYKPDMAMLEALRKSSIRLILGVPNDDIPTLASNVPNAEQWFGVNVAPYVADIRISYIFVGNEVVPSKYSEFIIPAMRNLQDVLISHSLQDIRATTTVNTAVLTSTYPPSASIFTNEAQSTMSEIVHYLSSQKAPLLITVYPYYAYASDPIHIRLDYAQFTATGDPVVQDGNLSYMNLFDAMVDGMFWAMEKAGVADVDVVVAETGWPHDGNGNITTVNLAKTYNQNFMKHILSQVGTPKRPGAHVEGFIFSMIDENQKAVGVEQNFGMFKPNLEHNYDIFS